MKITVKELMKNKQEHKELIKQQAIKNLEETKFVEDAIFEASFELEHKYDLDEDFVDSDEYNNFLFDISEELELELK